LAPTLFPTNPFVFILSPPYHDRFRATARQEAHCIAARSTIVLHQTQDHAHHFGFKLADPGKGRRVQGVAAIEEGPRVGLHRRKFAVFFVVDAPPRGVLGLGAFGGFQLELHVGARDSLARDLERETARWRGKER